MMRRFKRVLVVETNLGQLVRIIRDRFLVDAVPVSKVAGQPFKVRELVELLRSAAVEAAA
jgi:2-oxoglutarate ferredoxin oxidoreductase subunit alpha